MIIQAALSYPRTVEAWATIVPLILYGRYRGCTALRPCGRCDWPDRSLGTSRGWPLCWVDLFVTIGDRRPWVAVGGVDRVALDRLDTDIRQHPTHRDGEYSDSPLGNFETSRPG